MILSTRQAISPQLAQLACPRAPSKRRLRVRQSGVRLDSHQPPVCANPVGPTPICWWAGADDYADCIFRRTDTSHVLTCRAHGSQQLEGYLRWLGCSVASASAHQRRPWPRRAWRPRRLEPMPASCAEFEEKAHRTSWTSNCSAVPAIPPGTNVATRGRSRKFPHNGRSWVRLTLKYLP